MVRFDIFLEVKATAGKQGNWILNRQIRRFEVLFRFYDPEKSIFDKSWKLPGIEEFQ